MGKRIIFGCNVVIEYSFYALFFLVPLVISSTTSELFEFNKMWLTFGISVIVATSWIIKGITKQSFTIQRTPLDVFIFLFVASQVLATIFSWDKHISMWGYYSRFNGGLLSTLSYVVLYYAFASHVSEKVFSLYLEPVMRLILFWGGILLFPLFVYGGISAAGEGGSNVVFAAGLILSFLLIVLSLPATFVKRSLFVGIVSAGLVAAWGIPSHFGYDPTCFLFRGNLDVSCWTEAFQPKVRMFSTLGQPNWLGAYLSVLIITSLGFFLQYATASKTQFFDLKLNRKLVISLFAATSSFLYVALLFTRARSAFLAVGVGILLWAVLSIIPLSRTLPSFSQRGIRFLVTPFISIFAIFAVLTFIIGAPIPQLEQLRQGGTQNISDSSQKNLFKDTSNQAPLQVLEAGGTESGTIRLHVWKGALDIWRHYPLFGTGVETFAFAYYKFRPVGHNLTSEWDYLYNKAHNEYLNFLATTGTVGFVTYLLMIYAFLWKGISFVANPFVKDEIQISIRNKLLIASLIGAYASILISNFFGFSVVIMNVFLFLIPAFVFSLANVLEKEHAVTIGSPKETNTLSSVQGLLIALVASFGAFLLFILWQFLQADKAYALGSNLARTGAYDKAYIKLKEAVSLRGDEPVLQDELSSTSILLTGRLLRFQEATSSATAEELKLASEAAQELANEAIDINNKLVSAYPYNLIFLKTRARIFSALGPYNASFVQNALETLKRARVLAPTDAKIAYSLGVAYGQNGDTGSAIKMLETTVKLRPMYDDAWYALGLFYHQAALNAKGAVVDTVLHQKGVKAMRQVLVLTPKNAKALEALESWGEQP
ncbi:MAG: hypothetical protein A3J69_01690 [Candidatus Levybacteria bacterium RIFCSPHIGHO2_02_FULL_42_12]|nr:MAG: hypothetical protein A3J69_01690 [Candidatus Levybacteria bacterium RIFCSPHIGHO2_02_FULL_42_12]